MSENAGPDRAPCSEIVARSLTALGDPREVGSDPEATYWGGRVNAHSLVPFLSPYDHQGNPTVRQYLGTVSHFYPGQFQALDIYTQHAWTAAMVFVEAVRKAGKDLTRDSLVQALNGIQNFQTGWSVPLSYGSGNHDPNRCFTYTANNGSGWHTTTGWICS